MAKKASKKGRKAKLGRKLAGYSIAAGAALALGATGAQAAMEYAYPQQSQQPLDFIVGNSIHQYVAYSQMNSTGININSIYSKTTNGNQQTHRAYFAYHKSGVAVDAINFKPNKTISSADFNSAKNWAFIGYWCPTNSKYYGNFQPGTPGFIGVKIKTGLGSSQQEQDYYGWVEVTEGSKDASLTINEYAWNDAVGAGAPIPAASPVPEPGTLALLAIGAAGLVALRRKKISDEASA